MFESWGRIVFRRRRLVLLLCLLVIAAGAVWGTGVFRELQSSGGFTPPTSESQQEANIASRAFGRDSADVVVLYTGNDRLTVHSAAYRSAVTDSLARLPASRVTAVRTYWSTGSQRTLPVGRPLHPPAG